MTDETTRLRDALLDARYELSGVLYPYTSTMPDDVHLKYAKALDALIKAAAAEARAGLVSVTRQAQWRALLDAMNRGHAGCRSSRCHPLPQATRTRSDRIRAQNQR